MPAFPDEVGAAQPDSFGEGLARAGQVLGVVGLVLALVPLLSLFAFPCALLAIVLGGSGRAAQPRSGNAGIAFGVLAILVALLQVLIG